MSDAAVAPPQWRGPRLGVRGGLLAIARGPVLFAAALAGLVLLFIPLLLVFLGLLGLWNLFDGGPQEARNILAALLAWGADAVLCRYLAPAALVAIRRLAGQARQRSARWCGVPIAEPYLPAPEAAAGKPGYRQRLEWLLSDPATWRDMLWIAINACAGWILAAAPFLLAGAGLIVFSKQVGNWWPVPSPGYTGIGHPDSVTRLEMDGVGAVLLITALWAGPWLLWAYGMLARSLLGPRGGAELTQRVRHLAQTRSETIDASAAEIRRIERDLHDGAQARLVAMGMTLGTAADLVHTSPAAARALLLEAQQASATALAELRALVRGIHPPVLADRGLADAVRALALDSGLHVGISADLRGRPQAPVESAAYFAVCELLANVSKHAGARQAWIDIRHSAGMLRIGVTDNGCGGADPARGTGLRGIERRLAAFDGVLAISSPPGGPTVVNMEIPCELSSPKTSSC